MPNTISTSSTDLTGAVKSALAPFIDSGAVAGAVVLVAGAGGNLAQVAAGFSDIAARTPMRTDALFWIASQTKPVTATALSMLIDEGLVRLDDPVEKYLPEFSPMWVSAEKGDDHVLLIPPRRRITVRDILSHMSGMPFGSAIETPTRDLLDLSMYVRSYAMTPLGAQPGERYEYSNAGINTAGRIIEVVSGMSYEKFLQERLFDPLGMSDTTFFPTASQLTRLAKPYQPNSDGTALEETTISQLHYPLDSPIRRPMPGGGLFSTATDMGVFCRMILNGGELNSKRYLSRAAIVEMSTRQTPPHLEESYGLGWGVGEHSFEHGGALSTGMSVFPKHGFVVVFHVQHNGFLAGGERCRGEVESAVKSHFA